MTDVELVIKISEKVYNALTHIEFDANLVTDEMRKSIANGTPLPKGHGNLIDENELIDEIVCEKVDGRYCDVIYAHSIYEAETIIEADKEESEEA